jgi:hypothetical protein
MRHLRIEGAFRASAWAELRDVARILATAFDIEIPDLAQLDAASRQLPLFQAPIEEAD